MSQWHVCNNAVMHHHVLKFCWCHRYTSAVDQRSLFRRQHSSVCFLSTSALLSAPLRACSPFGWTVGLIDNFISPRRRFFSSLCGRTKEEFYPRPLGLVAPQLWQTISLVFFQKHSIVSPVLPLLSQPFSSRHPGARGSTLTLCAFPARWWTSTPDLHLSWPQEFSFHSSKSEMWRTLCLLCCIFIAAPCATPLPLT